MRKLWIAGVAVMGTLSLSACDGAGTANEAVNDDTRVVDRDSVATEYEVTETVVEYDTTTRTKTVDADDELDD